MTKKAHSFLTNSPPITKSCNKTHICIALLSFYMTKNNIIKLDELRSLQDVISGESAAPNVDSEISNNNKVLCADEL